MNSIEFMQKIRSRENVPSYKQHVLIFSITRTFQKGLLLTFSTVFIYTFFQQVCLFPYRTIIFGTFPTLLPLQSFPSVSCRLGHVRSVLKRKKEREGCYYPYFPQSSFFSKGNSGMKTSDWRSSGRMTRWDPRSSVRLLAADDKTSGLLSNIPSRNCFTLVYCYCRIVFLSVTYNV